MSKSQEYAARRKWNIARQFIMNLELACSWVGTSDGGSRSLALLRSKIEREGSIPRNYNYKLEYL